MHAVYRKRRLTLCIKAENFPIVVNNHESLAKNSFGAVNDLCKVGVEAFGFGGGTNC